MSVRAVIFDFGGVLCFHPTEEKFARIAGLFRIPVPRLFEIFWANRAEYDSGALSQREYWTRVAEQSGGVLDETQLPLLARLEVELWNAFDERILGWASHLQAMGFGTAILSNLPETLGRELRTVPGFLDPFDHVTFSYELGVLKPDAAIYRDALRGLRVEPQEALFLDDKPENVEGALAVGLRAELYTTWEDFLGTALRRYRLPAPTPDVARFQ